MQDNLYIMNHLHDDNALDYSIWYDLSTSLSRGTVLKYWCDVRVAALTGATLPFIWLYLFRILNPSFHTSRSSDVAHGRFVEYMYLSSYRIHRRRHSAFESLPAPNRSTPKSYILCYTLHVCSSHLTLHWTYAGFISFNSTLQAFWII
jgi:hypothetical protein